MGNRESVVHSDAEILGGAPVFVGTRVPLKNLIDYLAVGDGLDDFLNDPFCDSGASRRSAGGR